MDPAPLPRVQPLLEREEDRDQGSTRQRLYGLLFVLLTLGLCTLSGLALKNGWSPSSLRLVDEIFTESKPLWQARLASSWQARETGSGVKSPGSAGSGSVGANSAVVDAEHAAVASEDPRCSEIGKRVLKSGGNAVDAGIATVLCMGVVNPMASGIGGGAFILIRAPNGSAEFIDCRETAPAAATQDMFEGHEEDIFRGGLSVGVPGELRGLHLAWQRHGTLTWRDLVTPAADMAQKGFHVAAYLAASIAASNATILADPGLSAIFAPGGRLLREGDTCYHPALGETLRAVAENGPDALYRGERARGLVGEVRGMGGLLTEEDLNGFRAVVREVILGEAFGLEFVMAPPPSSGGAVILQVLKILQGFDLPLASAGPLGVHRVVESLKHAFALRMHLGDPAFVNVTDVLQDMLSDEFAAQLRSAIHDEITFPPEHYGHPEEEEDEKRHPHRHQLYTQLDDHGTSHTCVVDEKRMAVSITSTVNGPWGAGRMAVKSGILLNNEMADFSLPDRPGRSRSPFEPPPAPANFIRAGKRPLSSMSPTIVLQDGQLRAVIGGAGGSMIISAVLHVILHYFCQGYSPLKAVVAPRIHHQLLPNTLFYEAGHALFDGESISLDNETLAALIRRNHTTFPFAYGGFVQLILQDLEDPDSLPSCAARKLAADLERPSLAGKAGGKAGQPTHLPMDGRYGVVGTAAVDAAWSLVKQPNVWRSKRRSVAAVPFLGRLTAVSDPRKDGGPAGY